MSEPEFINSDLERTFFRILVVVPAFNEERALPELLRELIPVVKRLHADILVVNDHSRDRTGDVAHSFPSVMALHLPCNLGIGGAVQAGFKFACKNGYEALIQVDGDGQHLPSEIEKLLTPIFRGESDVALGSRFLEKGGWRSTKTRQLGIRIFRWTNQILLRQKITDSTSGFRAYNRRAIDFFADYYPTDYPEPEAVVMLCRAGFRLKEIPVRMVERQGGRSSITAGKSFYYMVKVLLAVCIRALS